MIVSLYIPQVVESIELNSWHASIDILVRSVHTSDCVCLLYTCKYINICQVCDVHVLATNRPASMLYDVYGQLYDGNNNDRYILWCVKHLHTLSIANLIGARPGQNSMEMHGPHAVLCGLCKYYVAYYYNSSNRQHKAQKLISFNHDFLILYCDQTPYNTNCMVCTELALGRYVA